MERVSTSSRRAMRRLKNAARRAFQRAWDRYLTSYALGDELDSRIARLIPEGIGFYPTTSDLQAVRHFLDHRFDLLGSGWTTVRYGMKCLGLEGVRFEMHSAGPLEGIGKPNQAVARSVRARVSSRYEPIDWQLDYKSGYRWSERTWYRDIRYGAFEGADVKVPWELSRMQHLPELAVAYAASKDPGILREFSDQILDWIAANPPRFGVNWACTMDAGIRIANWLIAFDLLRAAGAQPDSGFTKLFAASVFDHARHIARNLEWSETRRANHYLGNIGGLLLAAAYLPASAQTDAWLLFAVQELMDETDRQFLADGGHFEASTSYHRLCAEVIAVCAVFVRALPAARVEQAFRAAPGDMPYGPALRSETAARLKAHYTSTGSLLSPGFLARLSRAADLTRSLTRSDGSVAQIGDDDSGRFVRLGGWIEAGSVAECRARYLNLESFEELPDGEPYVMQSPASHQQWLAWAGAALGRTDLLDPAQSHAWALPKALAEVMVTPSIRAAESSGSSPTADDKSSKLQRMTGQGSNRTVTHRLSGTYRPGGGDLFANARYEQYPLFGVYIVRSDRIHLVIRCGCAVHDQSGVHAHEDQLSFDLMVDGRRVAADPGTYVYTPSKRQRNAYRSAHAHHAPSVDGPSSGDDRDIFSSPSHVHGHCIEFDARGFVGRTIVDGGEVTRKIAFHPYRIEIHDEYALSAPWKPASVDVFKPAKPVVFSPGYGVRIK